MRRDWQSEKANYRHLFTDERVSPSLYGDLRVREKAEFGARKAYFLSYLKKIPSKNGEKRYYKALIINAL